MSFNFEQLNEETRAAMLSEFESEQRSERPYFGKHLSVAGVAAFPNLMKVAIVTGDEVWLADHLDNPLYWNPTENYERDGIVRAKRINLRQASERLANSEFNTWYVRGLARCGMQNGIELCEVYRAAQPKWEPADCKEHEGVEFRVADVYFGHRAKYWPEPGNPDALSVPFGPGCHHTIRLKDKK
jgi:hypothetical protein